jgi:hypothetical protein
MQSQQDTLTADSQLELVIRMGITHQGLPHGNPFGLVARGRTGLWLFRIGSRFRILVEREAVGASRQLPGQEV